MKNDDESFLSAYLDGELSPAQQRGLESALAANAELAEKLRALTVVRDLIAGLPRDASIDVAARVMQRIRERGRGKGLLPTLEGWRRGSRRLLPLAGLAASAASLMVAASLAILVQTSRFERAPQSADRQSGTAGILASDPTASAGPSEASTIPSPPEAIAASPHPTAAPVPSEVVVAAPSAPAVASEIRAAAAEIHRPSPSGDAAHVRQFLDNPNLKRFFWVKNGPRNDSEQVVSSIIERTTAFDYFKIALAQGVLIDSRHREEATVIAFDGQSDSARAVERSARRRSAWPCAPGSSDRSPRGHATGGDRSG